MAEEVEKTTTEEQKPTAPAKSAEEQLKELQAALTKANAAVSRANSEAADWKRKFNENVDKQKADEIARAEALKKDQEELAMYREKSRIDSYTAKLMKGGADAATAETMAKALPEGVEDSYFDAFAEFNKNQRKNLDLEALSKQPSLSVGLPLAGQKSDEDKKLDKWFGL